MTIHLATDHAGFAHKEAVLMWLRAEGYNVVDHGAFEYDALDDYPDFIALAAVEVSKNPAGTKAIIFGGSGQGEAMVANRFPNVRATVYYGAKEEIITLSRQHNDANVLSIGARFVEIDVCKQVIWDWLHTDFSTDEKYQRRNKKISILTKKIHS